MATSPMPYDDTARGLGLSGVLETVRRRRALALLPFLFVLTTAASLALFLPSLWTARAVVLVDRQQIPEAFVKSTVAGEVEARLLTLSQDVLNPRRLQKIIQDHNLYPQLRHRLTPDQVVEKMRKDIRIELGSDDRERRNRPDAKAIVFAVSYTAPHPQVAAIVANKLAALYSEENTRQREQQAVGTSKFLDTQMNDVRDRLVVQEKKVTGFKERYMGELPEQRDTNLRTLERLETQLQMVHENNRRAHERRQLITQSLAEIDQTTGLVGASGPSVSPADTGAARLNLLRQELAEMQTKYSDRYPDVGVLKEQIRALEAKVAGDQHVAALARQAPAPKRERELRVAPQNPYVQSLMGQLDQANVEVKAGAAEIASLKQQIAAYQRRIENTPRREQELALINRDYETTRDLFRSLLAKRGEADIAADLEHRKHGEQFRVIEPAGLPERAAGPNRMRLLMVGLALALGAGALAVILAEQVDTSYRRVDDVRAAVSAPILSTIPRITTEGDRVQSVRQRRLATAAVAVGLLAVAGSSFAIAHNNQTLVSLLMPSESPTAKR